jgi:hypothetical protein
MALFVRGKCVPGPDSHLGFDIRGCCMHVTWARTVIETNSSYSPVLGGKTTHARLQYDVSTRNDPSSLQFAYSIFEYSSISAVHS